MAECEVPEKALYPTIAKYACRVDWPALGARVPRLYYALQLLLQHEAAAAGGGGKQEGAGAPAVRVCALPAAAAPVADVG